MIGCTCGSIMCAENRVERPALSERKTLLVRVRESPLGEPLEGPVAGLFKAGVPVTRGP